MPVYGFPEMLEHCLSKLILESSLSSYKIVSSCAGKSTVVLHFEAMSNLASELPSCPPRHKSPSKCVRDRERRRSHFSTHNKQPSKSPRVSPSPTKSLLVNSSRSAHEDSGVESVPSSSKHKQCSLLVTQHPTAQTSPFSKDVLTNSMPPVCAVSSTLNDPPFSSTVCSDPEQSSDSTPQSTQPLPIYTPECKQSETSEINSDLFWCKEDFEKLVDSVKKSSPDTLNKLCDPQRNSFFRHVIQRDYSDNEGGPAIVAQSDDLVTTFFIDSKTIGPTIVLSDTEMTNEEKVDYEQFLDAPFHRADRHDFMSLKTVVPELLDFIRDTIQR